MPEGWATTDLMVGLRDRSSVTNGTRRATRCRMSLGDPLSRVVVWSTGHQRLPYLSRMCSSMASVVAHLTPVRLRPKERATRTGQGRGGSELSRRIAPAMWTRAAW